jgi:hypothetical protein
MSGAFYLIDGNNFISVVFPVHSGIKTNMLEALINLYDT